MWDNFPYWDELGMITKNLEFGFDAKVWIYMNHEYPIMDINKFSEEQQWQIIKHDITEISKIHNPSDEMVKYTIDMDLGSLFRLDDDIITQEYVNLAWKKGSYMISQGTNKNIMFGFFIYDNIRPYVTDDMWKYLLDNEKQAEYFISMDYFKFYNIPEHIVKQMM